MTSNLRDLIARRETLVAPGASDALSARLIEAHHYKCVYIGSYATAASRFALSDTGRLSLEQLGSQATTIADAVSIPVIADAEAFDDTPAPASTPPILKNFMTKRTPQNGSARPSPRARTPTF